jgi:hypothetical protein
MSEADWARDGYELHRALLASTTCEALLAELSRIIAAVGAEHERGERADDFWRQLARSTERLEVFFAPPDLDGLDGRDGLDGPDETDEIDETDGPVPRAAHRRFDEARVMRVGHALHRIGGPFGDALLASPVADVLLARLGGGARAVQSAVVYKQPRSDLVQFGYHQDAAYLTTDPPEPSSLALAFVALDDMDGHNGGLWVAPGSHHLGLGERLRLGPRGYEHAGGRAHRIVDGAAVLVPMRRGDVAILDGLTCHASFANRSGRPRRALILHAITASARMAETSWVQEPVGGFAPLRPR